MAIRNDWRPGDWLMMDQESGAVYYRSQMAKNWDGTWRHKDNIEQRQPQEFVKARRDPRALKRVRPEPDYPTATDIIPLTIGETGILTRVGPAAGVFGLGILGGDPGIGSMIIEGSAASGPFIVR